MSFRDSGSAGASPSQGSRGFPLFRQAGKLKPGPCPLRSHAQSLALIRYRAFQNWDPPALAEIWRAQPPLRGRMQPMTPSHWESIVLAKPYFDRQGLIVACDGARPVGFVHAGFGASDDHQSLDCQAGTICQLLTVPHPQQATTALELLAAGENYLRTRGAGSIHAGCAFPFNPFYVGLYGSSEVPGVLTSDLAARDLFSAGGYCEGATRVLLHRTLSGFKPPVTGQMLQVKRKFQVRQVGEVMPDNWWDNCVWSSAVWLRFALAAREAGEPVISATFWEIQPLSQAWGVRTVGLVCIDDTPEARSEGLTLFLLAESLRMLGEERVAQFEAQCAAGDGTLLAIFKQLGLAEHDRGMLLRKEQ